MFQQDHVIEINLMLSTFHAINVCLKVAKLTFQIIRHFITVGVLLSFLFFCYCFHEFKLLWHTFLVLHIDKTLSTASDIRSKAKVLSLERVD